MKLLVKKISISISFLSMLFLCACNSEKSSKSSNDDVAIIEKITNQKFTLIKHFPVEGHNMTAYLMESKQGGQPVIFYSNNTNGDIFYGVLFDKDGNNLTEKYVHEHINPMMATKLFASVDKAHAFRIGKPDAPHQIYMIAEPNCSVCHKLYSDLKPFVSKGELSIELIMTAFLHENSTGKAAEIMQSADPVAVFNKDESAFDEKNEEGGIKGLPADQITEDTKKKLKDNLDFMTKTGIRGTPAIFYRDSNGNHKRIDGYPQENLQELVDSIGKLEKSTSPVSDATKSVPSDASKTTDVKKDN